MPRNTHTRVYVSIYLCLSTFRQLLCVRMCLLGWIDEDLRCGRPTNICICSTFVCTFIFCYKLFFTKHYIHTYLCMYVSTHSNVCVHVCLFRSDFAKILNARSCMYICMGKHKNLCVLACKL